MRFERNIPIADMQEAPDSINITILHAGVKQEQVSHAIYLKLSGP